MNNFFAKFNSIRNKKEEGVTILLAILILAAIMAISFSLATIIFIEVRSSSDLLKTEGALYGATGVAEQAMFNLKRDACPTNSPTCYFSQFTNSVALSASPYVVPLANPIFSGKVLSGSTFSNTSNLYDLCGTSINYNPDATLAGCGYGKLTVNYITTNGGTDPLYAYLCQWDQNAPADTYPNMPPCSTLNGGTNQLYWLAPNSSGDCSSAQEADGGALLTSTTKTCVTWTLDPSKQQQLILTNPTGAAEIYYSAVSYDTDGVTPKGLPYVGSKSIEVGTKLGAVGRRIRATVPSTSVTTSDTNLAVAGSATQVSTYPGGDVSKSIDGNTDGDWANGSVSHTNFAVSPWIDIDLGSTKTINSVVVWNRTDGYQTRLSDYWVFVSSNSFGPAEVPLTLQFRSNTWNSHQTSYPNPSTSIPFSSVSGRYIRLQLSTADYLNLAEIQVFGH